MDEQYGTNNRSPLILNAKHVERGMPFNFMTMYFRASYLKSLPKFDLSLKYAMDLDLVCSMYKKDQFKSGVYLGNEPTVTMHAGGVSDKYELNAHEEAKEIIKRHDLWSDEAEKLFSERKFRLKTKHLLNKLGLSSMIKVWRRYKWKNSQVRN